MSERTYKALFSRNHAPRFNFFILHIFVAVGLVAGGGRVAVGLVASGGRIADGLVAGGGRVAVGLVAGGSRFQQGLEPFSQAVQIQTLLLQSLVGRHLPLFFFFFLKKKTIL